jgi:hypothetical protein
MLIGVGFLFVAWTGLILRNWQKRQDEEIKNLYYISNDLQKALGFIASEHMKSCIDKIVKDR